MFLYSTGREVVPLKEITANHGGKRRFQRFYNGISGTTATAMATALLITEYHKKQRLSIPNFHHSNPPITTPPPSPQPNPPAAPAPKTAWDYPYKE